MNFLIHGFNLLIIIIIGGLYLFMPELMNKYLLFGVSINDEILKDKTISDIKRQYKIMAFTVLTIIILIYIWVSSTFDIKMATLILTGIIIFQIIISYLIYFKQHKIVKQIKSKYEFIEETLQTIEIKKVKEFAVLKSIWFLIYLAIIIVLVIISIDKYSDLPELIATHFNSKGIADGFSTKSYGTIMLMPITMMFMTLMFMGINYTFKKAKEVSGSAKNKLSFEQESKFRCLWSIASYLMGLILMGIFTMIQLNIIGVLQYDNNMLVLIFGATVFIIIIIIGLIIYTGQSGSRIKTKNKGNQIIDTQEDAYWKGGIIYFNPKDSSVFVNKRFGIGMTLNFGNMVSWIILIAIIGFIIFSLTKI